MPKKYHASTQLIHAVLSLAPPVRIVPAEQAPKGLLDIRAAFDQMVLPRKDNGQWPHQLRSFPVNDQGHDDTIWGLPSINAAFRGLHDYMHALIDADFGRNDEHAVALATSRYVDKFYPHLTNEDHLAMYYDIVGQVEFFHHRHAYTVSQSGFVQMCFNIGLTDAILQYNDPIIPE